MMEWLTPLIAPFIVLNVVIGLVTYVTLLERKFAARMQSRIGPYRVGPHGLLQPIADALKLMMKEDIVPTAADRRVYNLAPIVFLLPCMLIFATIPFAPGLGVADLNIGILFFLAVSSMEIVGLFMAGWGSNNKYALLSAMRAVNQIISYDLPFIFAALVPVMLAGSLRLSDIAAAQDGLWFVFYPVIGQLAFIFFIVATLAAENRVPFDILEAESELVAGFRVEYSGMKFALIQLGEYAHILGSSFLGALLFLGAWDGPGPAWLGPIWFLLKAMFVFLLVTWIRWSFVRIRVDQNPRAVVEGVAARDARSAPDHGSRRRLAGRLSRPDRPRGPGFRPRAVQGLRPVDVLRASPEARGLSPEAFCISHAGMRRLPFGGGDGHQGRLRGDVGLDDGFGFRHGRRVAVAVHGVGFDQVLLVRGG